MSNIFWKNFHLCFSSGLLRCWPPSLSPPSKQDPPATFTKNFNSIYERLSSSDHSKPLSASFTDTDVSSASFSSSCDDCDSSPRPDFAAAFASHRFFFSSPGRSNSIIESPDTRPLDLPSKSTVGPLNGGVAVKKDSPDPYSDFRRSMEEMIEARNLTDVKNDWEFLHELLFCYLALNPTNTHKLIIRAFTDILISLLSSSSSSSSTSHRKLDGYRT